MRFLAEFFPEFTDKFEEIDKMYEEKRFIDEKSYQFICLELAIIRAFISMCKKTF